MLLYKFLSAKTAINVLRTGKIRFAQLSALNDPFESFPPVDGFLTRDWVSQTLEGFLVDDTVFETLVNDAVLRTYDRFPIAKLMFPDKNDFSRFLRAYIQAELGKTGSNLRDTMLTLLRSNLDAITSQLKQQVMATLSDIVCVLSLSTAKCNHLMWVHYADSHSGTALAFDSDFAFFSQAVPVEYRTERIQIEIDPATATDSQKQAFARKLLTVKNISWNHEEEYRLVMPSSSLELTPDRDPRGLPVYVSTFPVESLAQVVHGCRMSTTDQSTLGSIVSEKYKNAQELKSTINSETFQITFRSTH